MNNKAIKSLLLIGITTIFGLTLNITESQAKPKMKFICDQDGKNFTTFAFTSPTEKKKVIVWEKSLKGSSPEQRCKKVTPRLQKIYDDGNTGLITNGKMNGKSVICVAQVSGGKCVMELMDLIPGDNSFQIINELKESLYGFQVGPIKHSSGSPQIYYKINFDLLSNSLKDK